MRSNTVLGMFEPLQAKLIHSSISRNWPQVTSRTLLVVGIASNGSPVDQIPRRSSNTHGRESLMTAGTSFRLSAGIATLRTATILVACLVAACLVVAPRAHAVVGPSCPASATTVDPSCFEGGDGNLASRSRRTRDWNTTLAARRSPCRTGPARATTMFSNGSKQQEPTTWTSSSGDGRPRRSPTSCARRWPRSRCRRTSSAGRTRSSSTPRSRPRGDSGNTAINLELNQKQTTWTNANGEVIPERIARRRADHV